MAVSCLSGERQFGIAFSTYQADYKNYFIQFQRAGTNWTWGYGLRQLEYLTSPPVFRCPGVREHITYIYSYGPEDLVAYPDEDWRYLNITYGVNSWFVAGENGLYSDNRQYNSVKVDSLSDPSKTVAMADSWSLNSHTYPDGARGIHRIGAYPTWFGSIHDRHQDAGNVLWCDGSAGTYKDANHTIQTFDMRYFKAVK